MRWLRILSTYEFDIQHRAGTKHGNADSLSRASHDLFLSKREATEVLADDQILSLGEAIEDDGQESEENYDSLDESDSENDPRLPVQDEFPVPQEIQQKLWLRNNKLILFCLRSDNGSRASINQRLKSTNLSPDQSFMLTALSTSS